jgi:hypothetical protein
LPDQRAADSRPENPELFMSYASGDLDRAAAVHGRLAAEGSRLRPLWSSPLPCMGLSLSSGCFGLCADSFLFGAGKPFFVPSPGIRFAGARNGSSDRNGSTAWRLAAQRRLSFAAAPAFAAAGFAACARGATVNYVRAFCIASGSGVPVYLLRIRGELAIGGGSSCHRLVGGRIV